jgi:trehalose-6-phosphate synthase
MYARNFFKTCQRILGYELEFLKGGSFGINFHGRIVMIRVSHIGIEEPFLKELTSSDKFKLMDKAFKNSMRPIISSMLRTPLVMCSIDSYHPI